MSAPKVYSCRYVDVSRAEDPENEIFRALSAAEPGEHVRVRLPADFYGFYRHVGHFAPLGSIVFESSDQSAERARKSLAEALAKMPEDTWGGASYGIAW